MTSAASELSQRLAQNVEAVCRTYLFNGHRAGGYWVVGDAENNPGSSLFVRLQGPDTGKGAAGKWTDAATGDHGDLLDLIGKNLHLNRLRDVLDEARSFLSVPRPIPEPGARTRTPSGAQGSTESARRLFAASERWAIRWPSDICAAGASPTWRDLTPCAFTRAASTDPSTAQRTCLSRR